MKHKKIPKTYKVEPRLSKLIKELAIKEGIIEPYEAYEIPLFEQLPKFRKLIKDYRTGKIQ